MERKRQRHRQRDTNREECVWGGGWGGVRFVVESIGLVLISPHCYGLCLKQ